MNYNTSIGAYARSLNATDISAQFEGFEIEFDEKVTLFPVQVEKATRSPRRVQELGVSKIRRLTVAKSARKGTDSGRRLR